LKCHRYPSVVSINRVPELPRRQQVVTTKMFLCLGLIRRRIKCPSSIFCQQERSCQFRTIRYDSSARSYSSTENSDDNDRKESDRVSIDIDTSTGVCHVRLNRPNKLNSFDLDMFEAVAKTACNLKKDRSIRAIILSGRGKAFSTGLDLSILKDGNPMKTIQRLLERQSRPLPLLPHDDSDKQEHDTNGRIITSNLAQDVSILWRELNVPVIAVLQGMCYGAGLQVALGADFRYSTPDCKLSIMEGKWGLVPDMGASILLRELVRIDVAKELTMTGRIISGSEAADLGLVTHVSEDPMKAANLFAEQLIERSPDAIAAAKQLFQSTWAAASDEESLLLETKLQRNLLASWNQLAASGRATVGWDFPYVKRK